MKTTLSDTFSGNMTLRWQSVLLAEVAEISEIGWYCLSGRFWSFQWPGLNTKILSMYGEIGKKISM